MLSITDKALSAVDGESTQLVIADDTTLGSGDLKLVGDVIGRYPKLERLVITNCDLTSEQLAVLERSIMLHPSLSQVDFSGNALTSLDFLCWLTGREQIMDSNTGGYKLYGSSRINSIDLSRNKAPFDASCKRFLIACFEKEQVAHLAISVDPWVIVGGKFTSLLQNNKCLIDMHFLVTDRSTFIFADPLSADEKNGLLQKKQNANIETAQETMERVMSASMISSDDVARLNHCMPAVIYLMQRHGDRAAAMEKLQSFHDRAKAGTGKETRIDRYILSQPKTAPKAPEAFSPQQARTEDIHAVVTALPPLDEAAAAAAIRTCRYQPERFVKLAGESLTAARDIARVSITALTALPPPASPQALFGKFISEFGKLVGLMQSKLKTQLRDGMSSMARKQVAAPQGMAAFFNTMLAPPTDMHSFVRPTEELGDTLRHLVPEIQGSESAFGMQHQITEAVIKSYDAVKDRLKLYIDASRTVMAEWNREQSEKAGIDDDGDKPPHMRMLEAKTAELQQALTRISAHRGNHIMHAEKLAAQMQRYDYLLEQNMPLLGTTVEGFARAMKNCQPGTVNTNMADQCVRAIDGQTRQIEGQISEIETGSTDIFSHFGELFLDRSLVISAAPRVAATPSAPEVK